MKAPSEGCGEKSCFASFSLYFPRRHHHAEAWVVGLLLSTSLPDGYRHTKYTLCNLSTPYMGSLWFPKAVSPIPPLSEGCSDVYLSWKVLLKTPPIKTQRNYNKTPPVELIYNFENNTASVMLKRDGYFITEW